MDPTKSKITPVIEALEGRAQESVIQFGRYSADIRARLFLVDGQPVELGSRAFDLLLALIEARGTVISKEDLIRRVWPDMIVDEANLRVQLAKVRKSLGDDRDLVKTVARQGYLFAAEVTYAAVQKPGAAPAEEAAAEPLGNLPGRVDSLIGRSVELEELRQIVGQHRQVTLTGPGGIGKTRLAIEAGYALAPQFPDGVWLIDLAPLADPAAVASAAASVLGARLSQAEIAAAAIAATIGNRRMLLIFDNCEHLVSGVADLVRELLAQAPGLSILATSQETLQIPGEQVCRLGPLGVPSEAEGDALSFGAVALFVERARSADRLFTLDRANTDGVVEICRNLDGIPLALEMAAARLPLLGLGGLRGGLSERLRMLKGSAGTAQGRHDTLRDMVEWSHGLLDEFDRQVFRRLAVFAGSFSLDAAVAVIGHDRWETVDALGRLIGKSLMTIERSEPPYYRLLETLRVYAAERLKDSGEFEGSAARHARYFAAKADEAYEAWQIMPEQPWLASVRRDLDNMRAALNWALADSGRATIAVTLAGAVTFIWLRLGLIAEGKRYTEQALALVGPETDPAAAGRLLKRAAGLRLVSDRVQAMAQLEQAVVLYRRIGDRAELPGALSMIGDIHAARGQLQAAKAHLDEAKDLLADRPPTKTLFSVMNSLAILATLMEDRAEARASFTRALELARAFRMTSAENVTLINLADLEFIDGDIDQAIEWGAEAVSRLRSAGERPRLCGALYNLAAYLLARDALPAARPVAEEALSLVREEGGIMIAYCLQQWALIAALEGCYREAARLIGFVDHRFSLAGETRQKTEQQIHDHVSAILAAELTPASIRTCGAEGAAWDDAAAMDYTTSLLAAGVAICRSSHA